MSANRPDEWESAAFRTALVCVTCGQGEGEWCVSSSGLPTVSLHANRVDPFREMWTAGYLAAQRQHRAIRQADA